MTGNKDFESNVQQLICWHMYLTYGAKLLKGMGNPNWLHLIFQRHLIGYGTLQLCLWFSNYLKNRKLSVFVDGVQSTNYNINAGVPQDAVLAPTPFLLFINDLLSITKKAIHSFANDRETCNGTVVVWIALFPFSKEY